MGLYAEWLSPWGVQLARLMFSQIFQDRLIHAFILMHLYILWHVYSTVEAPGSQWHIVKRMKDSPKLHQSLHYPSIQPWVDRHFGTGILETACRVQAVRIHVRICICFALHLCGSKTLCHDLRTAWGRSWPWLTTSLCHRKRDIDLLRLRQGSM